MNHVLLYTLLFISIGTTAVTEHSFYLDFGPNDGTNGNSTVGVDANGNTWNSITDGTTASANIPLLTSDNNSSDYTLSVNGAFKTNGILNGGLIEPEASLLGDFAIATATQDYFFVEAAGSTGSFTISGLDPTQGYLFTLFAHRAADEVRKSTYSIRGSNSDQQTVQSSGPGIGSSIANGNDDETVVSDTIQPAADGTITLSLSVDAGIFGYLNALLFEEFSGITFPDAVSPASCSPQDDHKIAFMGSSVCWGYAATDAPSDLDYYESFNGNKNGWVYNVAQTLDARHDAGEGDDWYITNVSISGDNTGKVLNRWENDLISKCPQYVVYCLSQANEGYDAESFKNGLSEILQKTRDNGIIPIVATNYSNGGMNDGMYTKTKDMNAWINSLDLPSINLLGALDNTEGQWGLSYQNDNGHPNDAGYIEMSTSVVPSLFEALHAGKPLPTIQTTSYITLDVGDTLHFKPESRTYSFTNTIDIKTDGNGTLVQVTDESANNSILVNVDGYLEYQSAQGTLTSQSIVNDGAWHTITLTHYHATSLTFLYVDGVQQSGSVNEQLTQTEITIGSDLDAETFDIRNWYFHRAGMNSDEMSALNSGTLIQMSLELYAPLDGDGIVTTGSLQNYAQSTNTIVSDMVVVLSSEMTISSEFSSTIGESSNESVSSEMLVSSNNFSSSETDNEVLSSSIDDKRTGLFECKNPGQLTFLDELSDTHVSFYTVHGKLMFTQKLEGIEMYIESGSLPMGVYYVAVQSARGMQVDIFNQTAP